MISNNLCFLRGFYSKTRAFKIIVKHFKTFGSNLQVKKLIPSLREVRFVPQTQWQIRGGEQNDVLVPEF